MANGRRPLTAKEKKQLEKKRKKAAKQAKKYHKLQEKQSLDSQNSKKRSAPKSQREDSNQSVRASVSENYRKRTPRKPKNQDDYMLSEEQTVHDSGSKIIDSINARQKVGNNKISREQKYRLQSEKKIKNLEPKESRNGGYYVDEFGARQKQERRLKQIRNQENEHIYRPKAPVSPKQIKRRRILIYSGIFLVVLIIGVVLSLTVLFKTEKIKVEGDQYYYEDQIVAFSNVQLQQNIFIAAMSGTPEEIVDNLPYVEDASISFNIPDTVIIKITNAVPSYVIKNGDEYLIISAKGRIIDKSADNPSELPELFCEELKSTEIGDYVSFSDNNIPDILEDVSESLSKNEVKNIKGFDVTDTANITLNYDNRISINLGLPEDLDYKIRTAMTIINEKLDPNNTGTVTGTLDVSNCNSTKVSRFKPSETEPANEDNLSATTAEGENVTNPSASSEKSTVTWENLSGTSPSSTQGENSTDPIENNNSNEGQGGQAYNTDENLQDGYAYEPEPYDYGQDAYDNYNNDLYGGYAAGDGYAE